MKMAFVMQTKRKKVLGTLAEDWPHMMLLNTINFAILVKEMRLTHHPELDPIDSAKNSEIPFILL